MKKFREDMPVYVSLQALFSTKIIPLNCHLAQQNFKYKITRYVTFNIANFPKSRDLKDFVRTAIFQNLDINKNDIEIQKQR